MENRGSITREEDGETMTMKSSLERFGRRDSDSDRIEIGKIVGRMEEKKSAKASATKARARWR